MFLGKILIFNILYRMKDIKYKDMSYIENIYRAYVREYDDENHIERIIVEYYNPGDRILVGYRESEKDSMKYANGVVVSAMNEVLVVNDCGVEVSIPFGWIKLVQDGSLPLAKSRIISE